MKEIKRLYVLQQLEDRKLTGPEAAVHLGVSLRQVRRYLAKFRQQGVNGLVHGNRGQVPSNRVEEGVRAKIVQLAEQEYADYNDSHFTEELAEQHGLEVSRSTVRRIRRAAGQKSPRKRRSPHHRSRRARKEKAGMLLQTDGSRHDWLEGRGAWLTLIAYIDDATNEVSGATFREEEDAAGYFLGLWAVCQQQGIPAAIYADRHTIFQSPAKPTFDPDGNDEPPRSQFGRLLAELGIELIAAQSPQAKGRIERLWGTLQDRLVKALRKAGASNREEANQVLKDFLPRFNQRFRKAPADPDRAYVPWPSEYPMEDFFCFKHTRTVTNDNTFPFSGHHLQIPPGPQGLSYAHKRVDVRQHLDGRLEVRFQNQRLAIFEPQGSEPLRMKKFTPAPGQTAERRKAPEASGKKDPRRPVYKPAANHPWRRYPSKGQETHAEELAK